MVGTGFQKRTDVILVDYSVSQDGTEMQLDVHVSSSMGYIRGFKDKGGGVKPHYLTFYSTFGGLNSSLGSANSFMLELRENDTEIYFNRPNGGYELALVKDGKTGQWIRPKEESELPVEDNNAEINIDEKPSTDEKPEHSDLYIEKYTIDDVLLYFEEVVLRMEYSDGTGDATCVQKWLSPIYYQLCGSYTDTDASKLNELFTQLNNIDGFPGIYPATDDHYENLTINFLNSNDFIMQFSDAVNGEDAYGAAEFWYYTETNELHTARIGYRTDIDQDTRNSILLEEIINVLGVSDSELRTDSIVYQYSNENTALSDVDILILKLLYYPKIECGMNYDRCAEIIKELYY
jgi:hypothetical protein